MRGPVGAWRLPVRIARREAMRARGRTVLMLVMIALPVMGVTAADVLIQTQDVSSAESVDRRLGTQAAAKVSVYDGPAFPVQQSRDPEFGSSGTTGTSERDLPAPRIAELLDALGGERRAVPFASLDVDVRTDRGTTTAGATALDFSDPLAGGFLDLITGRLPASAEEALVNQSLADRGPALGDLVTVVARTSSGAATERELRIVGIAESTSVRSWEQVFALPGAFGQVDGYGRAWLVSGDPVRWDAVLRANELGATVLSRAELLDPSPAALAADEAMAYGGGGIDDATLTVVILVVVMALIEVVLLAGPAFAVGARRQARPLALLAASGGTPAQARRVVLATGVVIGVSGAVVGVVLGIVAAAALEPVFQGYSDSWFGPFQVPWLHLLGVALFGFLSALLAAVVPAWIASRQDVVAVLAGRRGDRKPSARSPFVGVALLGAGVAVAWFGVRSSSSTSALLIGASALLSVFGMLLVVPVVVLAVSRAGRWLPLPLRFAVRDAARHRTRTTPAVAAVAATVAGVVALGIGVTSDAAENEATYRPTLPMGTSSLSAGGVAGVEPAWDEYRATIEREVPGATATAVLGVPSVGPDMVERYISWESLTGEDQYLSAGIGYAGSEVLAYDGELPAQAVRVDGFPQEEAVRVLEEGGAVRFVDRVSPSGTAEAEKVRIRVESYDPQTGEPSSAATRTVPVVEVAIAAGSVAPATGIIGASLAKDLGFETATVSLFVDGATPSPGQEQNIQETLNAAAVPAFLYVERGYEEDSETLIVQLVLAGLGAVLMLGGTLTATFLALSDARPDLATLSAVGATPRMRRGVAAGYALAVGGVGAVLGVMVGFVPGVAASYPLTSGFGTDCFGTDCPGSTTADHYLDVPWLMIGGLVVVLPLLVAGVVWLFARSRLPLVSRLA